jgi:hypothetical protein
VVAGATAIPGWEYYSYEYAGKSAGAGRPIAPSHAAFVVKFGAPDINRLMLRTNPSQVFVYVPLGTSGPQFALDLAQINKRLTCREVGSDNFSGSGLLVILSCSAAS